MKTFALILTLLPVGALAQEIKPEKPTIKPELALEIRTLEAQGWKLLVQAKSLELQLQKLHSQIDQKDAEIKQKADAAMQGLNKAKYTLDLDTLLIVDIPQKLEEIKYSGQLTLRKDGTAEFVFPKDKLVEAPNCSVKYVQGGPEPKSAVTADRLTVSGKPGNLVAYECLSHKVKE